MTDEKLDQILKQALSPEIDESEIQIQRKGKKVNKKKIISSGLATCAVLALVIAEVNIKSNSNIATDSNAHVNSNEGKDLFAITACAEELPEGISSGDVVGLNVIEANYGSSSFLDERFSISGENIDTIKITTDKCELYNAYAVYEGDTEYQDAKDAEANGGASDSEEYVLVAENNDTDSEEETIKYYYEHLKIQGASYEGKYDSSISFGMSVPEKLWSTNNDLQDAYQADVDQVNGATLTIEVTFKDGYTETHHYSLETGKLYIPCDEDGYFQYDNVTRFTTSEDECYSYGYLMEKID